MELVKYFLVLTRGKEKILQIGLGDNKEKVFKIF
jgi:hypothetical protein